MTEGITIIPGRSCGCIEPIRIPSFDPCRKKPHELETREQCCWLYQQCRNCGTPGLYWLDPARVLRNVERALAKAKSVAEIHPQVAEIASLDR